MARIPLFLLLTAFFFIRTAPAADRTLTAEGDYIQERDGKALAHWKLWHLRNGDYEVVETMAHPHVVQVFSFDSEFLPNGFSLTIDPTFKAPAPPQSFSKIYPTVISCRYGTQDLTCNTDTNGKKSVISVPANQPYVLVPGEFYMLDYTWFMTGVLHLIEHRESSDKSVTLLVFANDRVYPQAPIKLTYAGEVTAQIMGKPQSVREYEAQIWGIVGPSVLRVNSQSLVVSVRGKSVPRLEFNIGNYKEYQSWPSSRR